MHRLTIFFLIIIVDLGDRPYVHDYSTYVFLLQKFPGASDFSHLERYNDDLFGFHISDAHLVEDVNGAALVSDFIGSSRVTRVDHKDVYKD